MDLRTIRLNLFLVSSLAAAPVCADHFSGTSITYECVGPNQYRFYLDLYLDCAGVPITAQSLHFANECGVSFTLTGLLPVSSIEVSPLCPSQVSNSTCNGGTQPSFRRHRFQTTVFLSPCNFWTVDWYTCCRNTTQNVFLTPGTYVAATLNNLGGVCDRSPRFVDSGIPYVCVNQAVAYNPGVTDPDGDALIFGLISARYGAPAPTNVLYQSGFSGSQPFPGATINSTTGQLLFTPTATGYYVVVIEVKSYNSMGNLIGTVMRDLMFAVIACDGTPPASNGITSQTGGIWTQPFTMYACNGLNFCVNIPFWDPQVSNIIGVTSNVTTVLPGSTVTYSGTNPITAQICWTGNESILPQTIWFQASDGACPIPNIMSMSIVALDCTTLPVELVRFTAQREGDRVRTLWTTASESGTGHFTVERAPDAANFHAIGTLDAAGNSYELRDYTYLDPEPLPGTSYYRLRAEDQDGAVSFSNVVAVRLDVSSVHAVHDGAMGWMVSGAAAGSSWELRDALGRSLDHGVFTDAGAHPVPLPNGFMAVYMLIVHGGSGTAMLKLPPVAGDQRIEVSADLR